MYRILYISTARAPLSDTQMDEILATSRRHNRSVDVTGCLVVGGRRFLQALEGPREAVEQTFARISEDPRHFAIVKLNDKAIKHRSFARWAMGFERGGDTFAEASLAEQVAALLAPVTDPNLRAYFIGFATSHGKAA